MSFREICYQCLSNSRQSQISVLGTVVIAMISGLAGIILTNSHKSKIERKKLFASAYKAALSWQEMLYRVRRRGVGTKVERELVSKFHDIQEDLNYYQGLLSAESDFMGRSYKKLTKTIKYSTLKLIQDAWSKGGRSSKKITPETDIHPNNSDAEDSFLMDCRDWLSWYRWPLVLLRNKK